MKPFFLLLMVCGSLQAQSPPNAGFIDPTGTYILKGFVDKNQIMGQYGEIRIKMLSHEALALCFFINSGYPDYQTGAFVDTIPYKEDNLALAKPGPLADCRILFCFTPKALQTSLMYTDPASNCGFPKGVLVPAYFYKYSSAVPIIQDLSKHGLGP